MLACVATAGCGLGPTENSDAACTITITGAAAIAGTYTCPQPAVAIWVAVTNVGAVSMNISGTKSITGLFVFPGQPTAGVTYSTDKNPANLQSYGFIVSVGSSTWEFSAGQQKTPLGSGSLIFSSVAGATSGRRGRRTRRTARSTRISSRRPGRRRRAPRRCTSISESRIGRNLPPLDSIERTGEGELFEQRVTVMKNQRQVRAVARIAITWGVAFSAIGVTALATGLAFRILPRS